MGTTDVCAEIHGKRWTDHRFHPYSHAVVWSVTKAALKYNLHPLEMFGDSQVFTCKFWCINYLFTGLHFNRKPNSKIPNWRIQERSQKSRFFKVVQGCGLIYLTIIRLNLVYVAHCSWFCISMLNFHTSKSTVAFCNIHFGLRWLINKKPEGLYTFQLHILYVEAGKYFLCLSFLPNWACCLSHIFLVVNELRDEQQHLVLQLEVRTQNRHWKGN